MRIERLQVTNFRNLADIDISLASSTVIVGENRSGKTNLVQAIRLVLDPRLSYAERQLGREDFWDGLSDGSEDWDPMAAREVIEISVDIVDFENDPILFTALSDALVQEDPPRARLTYRFGPDDEVEGASAAPRYRGEVLGGAGIPIENELRRYIVFVFLHALRDVENDIRNWKKSPLRALLEAAASGVDEKALEEVHKAMAAANKAVNSLDPITSLGTNISDKMQAMVGDHQALETELAVAPDDPLRLIRGMRIFVDGDAHRPLGSSSLGAQNVLYWALLELGLEHRLSERDIAYVMLAIEEPEAHLHPHLQRLMFRNLLGDEQATRSVLVTTHSPQIVSVSNPRSIVALRGDDDQVYVAEASRAELEDADWDDIGRYLDVTRAEMVFARRVLFVEGFGEQALLPVLAMGHDIDLDKQGITVCAVHGTHFGAYVKFCDALKIPWAVITDGDPEQDVTGSDRAAALVLASGGSGAPEEHGIFVGPTTLEYDIVTTAENTGAAFAALKELVKGPSAKKIDEWGDSTPSYDDFMKMIKNAGGKGRFAQRLTQWDLKPPGYVAAALDYLVSQ